VVVVVSENLNQLEALLAPVVDQLRCAGLLPSQITLLCPPDQPEMVKRITSCCGEGSNRPATASDPAGLRGVAVAVHDPADRTRLSYLASTKAGRRIYLNRSLVDADQIVILSRTGYDPILGYTGGLGELFPALSDEATRQEYALRVTGSPSYGEVHGCGTAAWQEAQEVGWLLGMPFVVEILEGSGDEVSYILGGSAKRVAAEAERLLNRHWRVAVKRTADVVVAAISGDSPQQTFEQVSRALACAARVVRFGGCVVVLCRAPAPRGPGADLLRQAENPVQGLLLARQQKMPDLISIWQLATAAQQARLFLLSDIPATTAEELFFTPLDQPEQVQRLLNDAESCLILPDAHRTLAVME
jgi:nickel-dependent lactate racemase